MCDSVDDQQEPTVAVLLLDELGTDGAQLDVHRRSIAREFVLRRCSCHAKGGAPMSIVRTAPS